jgi:RNA polymerase sigma-70 factor, ECF subfamily
MPPGPLFVGTFEIRYRNTSLSRLLASLLTAFGRANLEALKASVEINGAELVRRARAGDGVAWEEIVTAFSRRIFNLAYRFTSSAESAEDLTQEVFIRIYRTLDQYDPKQGDLANWLMRLARNLIIDDYRHRQRNPQNSMADTVEDHTYHLRAVGTSAQRDLERRELAVQVQRGIDKLPPDLKTCVILRDIEELSYQEIVDVLKIPEGTVKSRINRGRIELAKILRRMRVLAV